MRMIVVLLLLLVAGLNAPSTASAAARCLRAGSQPRPPQALVAARPGTDPVRAVERGAQDGEGPVVVRRARAPCAQQFWLQRNGAFALLWVDGWAGTISSGTTRIPGLVAATDVTDAVRGGDRLEPGGHVDLAALRNRLERNADQRFSVRLTLVAILLLLAFVAPRRALVAGPAAIAAALLMSSLGWTSALVFAVLTLLGSLAPLRAVWLFLAVYLVVLAVSPETQALAVLGPHPEKGGRFYGVTNELETLLLAPSLLLGIPAAALVVILLVWSRAGADGGGALVFLGAYGYLAAMRLRRNPVLIRAAAAVAAVVVALGLVALDAASGGSSHVTRTVGDGPGAIWDAFTHRWSTSWDDATATPARTALNVMLLVGLAWIALQRPRRQLLDAFLVGIAVSLVVNDTPHDVLLFGSIEALALKRAL